MNKEAATKVCPFMSQVNHVVTWNNNGYNHDIKLNKTVFDIQHCVGDKCMAWKWNYTQSLNGVMHGQCSRLEHE